MRLLLILVSLLAVPFASAQDTYPSRPITLIVPYGAGGPVMVRVKGDGSVARLEVIDRGPGITPEDQARMFSAFERAEQEAKAHKEAMSRADETIGVS